MAGPEATAAGGHLPVRGGEEDQHREDRHHGGRDEERPGGVHRPQGAAEGDGERHESDAAETQGGNCDTEAIQHGERQCYKQK